MPSARSFDDPEKEDKANIIHRPHDRMTGSKPIEFIQATNPVVIIDEPQSVDTTDKSQEAIRSLNPLCTLRYSATHLDKHHMLYRLDSVDAYERKLVKQIEVAGIEVEDSHNKAYVKLLKVDNQQESDHAPRLSWTLAAGWAVKVARKTKWVRSGDDLLDALRRAQRLRRLHRRGHLLRGRQRVRQLHQPPGDRPPGAGHRRGRRRRVQAPADPQDHRRAPGQGAEAQRPGDQGAEPLLH
ncbi:MAG: hypothetical protein U5L11_00930 [Arhodomonas sp.]|nr:hypothetical protein [Arhodomonas sp.]